MSNTGRVLCVIPARYGSTRFPGKVIAPILDRPMVWWVHKQAADCDAIDELLVATDDQRVVEALGDYGIETVMTDESHESGTDRVAEIAAEREGFDYILNLQADEPLIEYRMLGEFVGSTLDEQPEMATLGHPVESGDPSLSDENNVQVVTDREGEALYFSRFPIPYPRNIEHTSYLRHVGIYIYRRELLLELTELEPVELERAEGLEQLRALYHGHGIRVFETSYSPYGVDTPEELEKAEEMLTNRIEMRGDEFPGDASE